MFCRYLFVGGRGRGRDDGAGGGSVSMISRDGRVGETQLYYYYFVYIAARRVIVAAVGSHRPAAGKVVGSIVSGSHA